MNHDQARQFVQALFRLVWEKRDRRRVAQFYSENLTGFDGMQPLTIKGIYDALDFMDQYYSKSSYMLHDLVCEGNRLACVVNVKLLTLNGEFERYSTLAYFFHVNRGKIVKQRFFLVQGDLTEAVPEKQSLLETVSAKITGSFANKMGVKTKINTKPRPQRPKKAKAEASPDQGGSQAGAAKDSAVSYDVSPGPVTFGKASVQVGVNPAAQREKDSKK